MTSPFASRVLIFSLCFVALNGCGCGSRSVIYTPANAPHTAAKELDLKVLEFEETTSHLYFMARLENLYGHTLTNDFVAGECKAFTVLADGHSYPTKARNQVNDGVLHLAAHQQQKIEFDCIMTPPLSTKATPWQLSVLMKSESGVAYTVVVPVP